MWDNRSIVSSRHGLAGKSGASSNKCCKDAYSAMLNGVDYVVSSIGITPPKSFPLVLNDRDIVL